MVYAMVVSETAGGDPARLEEARAQIDEQLRLMGQPGRKRGGPRRRAQLTDAQRALRDVGREDAELTGDVR